MTRPAVVRSLILGCAGELDAVTFAGVVATARIRPSVCQYSAIMSWARDNHGARIAVVLEHRCGDQHEHRWSDLYSVPQAWYALDGFVASTTPVHGLPNS